VNGVFRSHVRQHGTLLPTSLQDGVFSVCLDTVIAQLTDRFAADIMPIIAQMQYFAPWKLMPEEYVSPESINEQCKFYQLDHVLIARELAARVSCCIQKCSFTC
jgi:hypothetical protein